MIEKFARVNKKEIEPNRMQIKGVRKLPREHPRIASTHGIRCDFKNFFEFVCFLCKLMKQGERVVEQI